MRKLAGKVDREWLAQVKKTWKAWAKRKSSVKPSQAKRYLQEGEQWLEALAKDLAFDKGFFNFYTPPKARSPVQKIKQGTLEHLKEAEEALYRGRREVDFWENVLTPGSREYKMGGEHRHSLISRYAGKLGVPAPDTVQEADELLESDPRLRGLLLEKVASPYVIEAVTNADAVFSRKMLPLLSRAMTKYKTDLDFGTIDRVFDVNGVKVVLEDLPDPYPQEAKGKRAPHYAAEYYVKSLDRAYHLLKQKGLGFLWYGTMRVRCPSCGGANPHGAKYGVGAHYLPGRDEVFIYADPDRHLARLVAHELGHRYWYKFMSPGQRAKFSDQFQDIPAVSDYGGSNAEEDFAEVFSYYMDNKSLTRDQLERLKSFLRKKAAKAGGLAHRVATRWLTAGQVTLRGKVKPYERIVLMEYAEELAAGTGMKVVLRPLKRMPKGQIGDVRAEDLAKGVVNLRFQAGGSLGAQMRYIAHEMMHVQQYAQGRLKVVDGTFYWKGKPYMAAQEYAGTRSWGEYSKLPWEAEAIAFSKTDPDRWLATAPKKLQGRDKMLDYIIDNDLLGY